MMEEAPLVDSHAHLDSSEFADDCGEVVRRATEAGVVAIVTVGVDLASSRMAVMLAERYPLVVAAVGIHPHHASQYDVAALGELREMARNTRVVAIGEIGLDYFRNRAPAEAQRVAFRAQLELAGELDLPVIVHDREAHEEVLRMLRAAVEMRSDNSADAGVLHCFSGDVAMAHAATQLGFYISIAGPITYPKVDRLEAVVRALSADHLLVETDCPFLSPQPARGRRNEPANLRYTAERVARLRGQSPVELACQTTANAARLFGPHWPSHPAGQLRVNGDQ